MNQYKVMMSTSSKCTRLLLTLDPDELLRAILPAPSLVRHVRTAPTLLEGLSTWVDRPLHVVLSVDELESGLRLGLADPLGVGERSLYYHVDLVERAHRRRRGRRIAGLGDFGDLRQLRLVADGEAR